MTQERTKIKALTLDHVEKTLSVSGWLRTVRKSKNVAFLELNDGSCKANLQIILDRAHPEFEPLCQKLSVGTSICALGKLVKSQGAGQPFELQAAQISILGSCPADEYPLQKKEHTLEFLREIAHLRPRTTTFGALLRIRSALSFATHQFFQKQGFIHLHTPIITSSDCEGGGDQFCVSTINPDEPPRDGANKVDYKKDFFGKKAYLTVSGQLNAEAAACALSQVYTFGPTFRAENSHTTRHLAEFWMVEPEVAFATLEDVATLAEEYVKACLNYLFENCLEDLTFFDSHSAGLMDRLNGVRSANFTRLSYTEACEILAKAPKKFEFPCTWGCDLQTEHERYLAEEHCKGPVIVYNYPKAIKAFYMRNNEDGKTVAAMDLLMPKIGELIGGAQREEREEELKNKIQEQGLPLEEYQWYLELRRFGTVPHGGFGLGFERLLLFVTGIENIRDVIPFPRAPGQLNF